MISEVLSTSKILWLWLSNLFKLKGKLQNTQYAKEKNQDQLRDELVCITAFYYFCKTVKTINSYFEYQYDFHRKTVLPPL